MLSWWKTGGGVGSEDCSPNKLDFAGSPVRFQAGRAVLLSSAVMGMEEMGDLDLFVFFRSSEQGEETSLKKCSGCSSSEARFAEEGAVVVLRR